MKTTLMEMYVPHRERKTGETSLTAALLGAVFNLAEDIEAPTVNGSQAIDLNIAPLTLLYFLRPNEQDTSGRTYSTSKLDPEGILGEEQADARSSMYFSRPQGANPEGKLPAFKAFPKPPPPVRFRVMILCSSAWRFLWLAFTCRTASSTLCAEGLAECS